MVTVRNRPELCAGERTRDCAAEQIELAPRYLVAESPRAGRFEMKGAAAMPAIEDASRTNVASPGNVPIVEGTRGTSHPEDGDRYPADDIVDD